MRYRDDRHHLTVELQSKRCDLPADERTRIARELLAPLGEAVQEFSGANLRLMAIYHPRSDSYHVEARLKLPGKSLFAGDWDVYLDSAMQRCLARLVGEVRSYREHPDLRAEDLAERRSSLDRAIVAPEDPDAGPLAEAARNGNYRWFRTALAGYEEWLRKRIGRWIQRFPDAQARVGDGLLIGDVIEQVYLNAFERFGERSTNVRFSEWLERLIDLSLKAVLRHPDEEHQEASFARSVRETPLS
jgi:hypothetical protein